MASGWFSGASASEICAKINSHQHNSSVISLQALMGVCSQLQSLKMQYHRNLEFKTCQHKRHRCLSFNKAESDRQCGTDFFTV